VLRFATFVLLFASLSAYSQSSAQTPEAQTPTAANPPAAGSQQAAPEVAAAEASIAKSDWKSAETALDTWLAAHPADAQNRLDDAAALYRRAVTADPKSFEAHLSLGLLLARQNAVHADKDKLEQARTELSTATTLDPGDAGPALKARAWRALAQIDRASNATEASNDLLEALKLSPETPADTLLAATLADQAGEYEAAEAAYRRVLAQDPKSAPANAGLAHLLIVRKQYPEAETLIRAALDASPNDTALTAQLATVLAAQDKAEALPLIQKLHEAHPADTAVTRMLAEILADAGDSSGSDHLLISLLATAPEDPDLLIGHGQNLTHLLRFAEAFTAFNKATQIDPANADGWSGLAFAASRTNQPAITLHALTMRSKFLPEVPSTYFLWATAYDTLHQKAAATTYYHHFLESSAGKFPDQEWQARQRLLVLEGKP
jgi:predicted Zn-dependent protease